MKLFVAGLPYDFDDVDLKEMFELYGAVNFAKIVMDRETGKSKGFGFVDMPDETEARGAIETLDIGAFHSPPAGGGSLGQFGSTR